MRPASCRATRVAPRMEPFSALCVARQPGYSLRSAWRNRRADLRGWRGRRRRGTRYVRGTVRHAHLDVSLALQIATADAGHVGSGYRTVFPDYATVRGEHGFLNHELLAGPGAGQLFVALSSVMATNMAVHHRKHFFRIVRDASMCVCEMRRGIGTSQPQHRFAVASCASIVVKSPHTKHDVAGKTKLVADAVRLYILSYAGVDVNAAQYLDGLVHGADVRLADAVAYLFNPRRTDAACVDELRAFLDAARRAARVLLTPAEIAERGYTLTAKRILQNAAFGVPLLMFLSKCFTLRSFHFLGADFAYAFLWKIKRASPTSKRLLPPRITIVPKGAPGGFSTFPAGMVARLFVAAGEASAWAYDTPTHAAPGLARAPRRCRLCGSA